MKKLLSFLALVGIILVPQRGSVASAAKPTPAPTPQVQSVGNVDPVYFFTQNRRSYVGTNPDQGYSVTFSPRGGSFTAGTATFSLALKNVTKTRPSAVANKVTYDRGAFTEWYVNGPLGIEQGFTLARNPSRRGLPKITMTWSGLKQIQLQYDKKGVNLTTSADRVLQYQGLFAHDVDGKILPASFEYNPALPSEVSIIVNDAGARYPITIDPYVQDQKVSAGDGAARDRFGYTTAISDDGTRFAVGSYGATTGANSGQGAVYIYSRPAATWVLEQKITAADGISGDAFGGALSLSSDGSRIAIGAYTATVGGNTNQGAAYVFSRSGTTWTQEQKLVLPTGAAGDEFGAVSLSDDGSRLAIGAPGVASARGAVYTYTRSGTTWTQEQELIASDATTGTIFGSSVSLSGDGTRIAAGTIQGDGAYIFSRSGSVWTEEQKLVPTVPELGDRFGYSVSLANDGSRVVVGAYNATVGANSGQGAAYIFSRSGTTWTQEQKLTASDGAAANSFGDSLAMSGDGTHIVVGAYRATIATRTNQGAAYAYSRSGTTWAQYQKLTSSDGAANDFFASAVALSLTGARTVLGANNATIGANAQQGAAYIFTGP